MRHCRPRAKVLEGKGVTKQGLGWGLGWEGGRGEIEGL